MVVRRVAFLCMLLCLLTTVPSNLKLVMAAGQPLRLAFVCHDNCWGETEYCGRDANVATGVADMNHDCIVDGLDMVLFFPQLFESGGGLSGDLDGNNYVSASDLSLILSDVGMTASPCHSIPIPNVCDGTIAISFDGDPANNNAAQSPGYNEAYVVVSGVTDLRGIEFGLTTSPNITNLNFSFASGFGGNIGGDYVGWLYSPISGQDIVAYLTYNLTNSSPATIKIEFTTPSWRRHRWTTEGATVSHGFTSITSAGINGPTPGGTASCVPTGTITGRVHVETDNDCVFNGSDAPLSGRLVMAMPGSHFGYTDASGNYSIAVGPGQYEVSMFSNNPPSPCQDPSLTVNVTSSQLSSGNDFALEPGGVCHDGVWDDGEYCGRDAYTAMGVADMNHDCLVDGLDYVLLALQIPSCGPDLSGDVNGDNVVNAQDLAALIAGLGDTANPCNPTPIPVQCDGVLGLSFSTNPMIMINNATQAPGGPYSAWLVVNGVTGAKSVEFLIKASPNVDMGTITWFGGTGPTAFTGGSMWGVALFNPPLTGAVTVAKFDYFLTDSSPATISIAAPTPSNPWVRNRWAPVNVSVSHEFAYITNVGINGPTPAFTPACAPLGQITGTVYSDPNDDCDFNSGDTKLASLVVRADPGPHFAYTDANGDYSFLLSPDSYTVAMNGFNSPWNALSTCQSPKTHPVTVTANTTISGKDFALAPNGTLKGRVYSDAVTQCAFDVGTDVGLLGRRVEANPGTYVAYCDVNGNYSLKVPVGNYTVTQPAPALDPWVFPGCFAGFYPVNVAVNSTTTGLDFPLNLAGPACNMTTRIVSNGFNSGPAPCNDQIVRGPCPGIEQEYLVWVWGDPYLSNTTIPANQTITITLDAAFTINTVTGDCTITVIGSPNAYTRQVQFDAAIPPGTKCTVTVHATPSTFGPYTHVAAFNPGMACGGTYVTTLSEVSRCNSCDPNDMMVQPGCGDNGEVLADEPLTYTTRFQNIGLGAAENVVIESVLDADLDPNTLYIVKASHTITGVQLEQGNKLVIRFEGINLPGTPDEPNSHGYVIYSINQDAGLPDGTEITNTAAIFFDFNSPVVTNTALTTVKDIPCAPTAVEQPLLPVKTYLAQNHPNPFNPSTTIEYGLVSSELVSIKLYNVRGQLVQTLVNEHKVPGWYSVDWDGRDHRGNVVASGVYVSKMSAGSFVDTKKLILLK